MYGKLGGGAGQLGSNGLGKGGVEVGHHQQPLPDQRLACRQGIEMRLRVMAVDLCQLIMTRKCLLVLISRVHVWSLCSLRASGS